jgi:hypothetical protein
MREGEKQRQKHKEKERKALTWPGVKQALGPPNAERRVGPHGMQWMCDSVGGATSFLWGNVVVCMLGSMERLFSLFTGLIQLAEDL